MSDHLTLSRADVEAFWDGLANIRCDFDKLLPVVEAMHVLGLNEGAAALLKAHDGIRKMTLTLEGILRDADDRPGREPVFPVNTTREISGAVTVGYSDGSRTVHVSEFCIDDARTPRGAWTKETLAQWGVPWPPPAGWRKQLIAGTFRIPAAPHSNSKEA